MVRIKCEVCCEHGYLLKLKNYYRVRHYDTEARTKGEYAFYYHKQNQAYAENQLKVIKVENFNKQATKATGEHKHFASVQGV